MIDHFDLLAPLYDRIIGPPNPARLREVLRLPTAGCLLDAGGGTGRVASQLRGDVGELVVADASRPMLHRAEGKGELWWPSRRAPSGCPSPTARVTACSWLTHSTTSPTQRARCASSCACWRRADAW